MTTQDSKRPSDAPGKSAASGSGGAVGAARGDRVWFAVAMAVVVLGVALRLAVYAYNKALWLDELALLRSVDTLGVGGLFRPLVSPWELAQSAPIGFVAILWTEVRTLGESGYALRLWPMLASVLSMALAWPLMRRFVGVRAAVAGLVIMAVSRGVLYFAGETKQYSTELLVSMVVMLAALRAMERPTWGRWAALLAAGALGQFFALPTPFVLAGVGVMLAWDWWVRRDAGQADGAAALRKRYAAALVTMGVVWLGVFAMNWQLVLRSYSKDPALRSFWATSYLPPPVSVQAFRTYATEVNQFHRNYLGIQRPYPRLVAIGLVAAGVIGAGWQVVRRGRREFLVLLVPLLATLVATGLKLYPVGPRLYMFLLPVWCVSAAVAVEMILALPYAVARWAGVAAVAAGLAMIPSWRDLPWRPQVDQPMPELLAYVKKNIQPGDAVWVQAALRPQVEYYASGAGFSPEQLGGPALWGPRYPEMRRASEASLAALRQRMAGGGRVWLIMGFPQTEWELENKTTPREVLAPGRKPDEAVYFRDLWIERIDFGRP